MKYIHVNKHVIASNNKHGTHKPPLSFRRIKSGKAEYGHEIQIDGPCKIVYRPHDPLKCGAKVWIETEAAVSVIKEKNENSTNP